MLVNDDVPSIFGGVSQQAAAIRAGDKLEKQDNAYPAPSTGLGKRPPTEHIAKLFAGSPNADALLHWINRDAAEQYAVYLTASTIRVFRKSDGVEMTVSAPSGYGYLSTATVPRRDLICRTVADYTFVVNRLKVPAMDSATVGGTLTGTVQTFSALPGGAATGDVYKVEGTDTTRFDDYYVVKTAAGTWQETRAPGSDQYKFDASTMPHRLIKTGATTFTFEPITWVERLVGDATSNPPPSFIGSAIRDIFFYGNRLGLVRGEGVTLSQAADPLNMWLETMTAELDSDPIDTDADGDETVDMLYATTFTTELITFARNGQQFRLVSGEILNAKTARLRPVTKFEAAAEARPLGLGRNLYFAVDRGAYAGLREYFVSPTTITNDAAEVSDVVPRYAPSGVFHLTGTTTEDTVCILTTGDRSRIYVYKSAWNGEEKIQSAWSRWTLGTGDVILGAEFYGADLFLAVSRAGTTPGLYLERLQLRPGITDCQDAAGTEFLIHLDRKTSVTGSYNVGTDVTTWTLPYAPTDTTQCVLSGSGWGTRRGNALDVEVSGASVTATGDWSASSATFGQRFMYSIKPSPIFQRDRNGQPKSGGRLQILRLLVRFSRSGRLKAIVRPPGRDAREYQFAGKVLGSYSFVLGRVSLTDDVVAIPVMTENDKMDVEIQDDSYLPLFLQTIGWEGNLVHRARRLS